VRSFYHLNFASLVLRAACAVLVATFVVGFLLFLGAEKQLEALAKSVLAQANRPPPVFEVGSVPPGLNEEGRLRWSVREEQTEIRNRYDQLMYQADLDFYGYMAGKWTVFSCFSVAAALVGIVTFVILSAIRSHGSFDGMTRCGKCGQILSGLSEPRCPECGMRL